MSDARHLLLNVPDDWGNDDKGSFYEKFVEELLKPMRLRPYQRLRVTGMELDILARGEDQPWTVLVECKAHRDPLAADVITKLMGNRELRRADQAWLFSTSDLSKDGRGLWDDIQQDLELARKFTWYSPARTVEVLVSQRSVCDPVSLEHHLQGVDVGDWSLIVSPGKMSWLVELLADGIPAQLAVFDARTGTPMSAREARSVASASPRYEALQCLDLSQSKPPATLAPRQIERAPVARVISGDAWEDPRPARPVDFVGRDEVIKQIAVFVEQVRTGGTSTRSFSVLAPSGWGKSSLSLKLVHMAGSKGLERASITAVDSRSAGNASFVVEALRMALREALGSAASSKKNPLKVQSLREPLDSPDIARALQLLKDSGRVAVLIFDQFEELFAKESLFEVFNAVRDLTLDIDSAQAPILLGFAWKTDVSLPQQHPAYHLWHQLADRRKTFKVGEFKKGDIDRVISKAEAAIGKKLSRAVRSRLAEQCQGLPWLLKKLLVHVLQRISTPESQYLLLERQLDIEQLFKEDLEQLQDEHIRCLKFVASRAPVAVAEVEESFSRETTNLLISQHLLVRSGMNYVVYWDIFRDYLVEERVPEIPWARTFQRTPAVVIKALEVLKNEGALTALQLGKRLQLKEGPTFNLLGDMVSLQLADADGSGSYSLPSHLSNLAVMAVAEIARNQLRRHVVSRAIEKGWSKEQVLSSDDWIRFFDEAQLRNVKYSQATLRQYSGNMRSWLLFSGLIELRTRGIVKAEGRGAQMGMVTAGRVSGSFLGWSSPKRLVEVLRKLSHAAPLSMEELSAAGLRNAISDASALGLVEIREDKVSLSRVYHSEAELIGLARASVAVQATVVIAQECLVAYENDREAAARALAELLGATWKSSSALRVLGGLIRYSNWASKEEDAAS